MIGPFRIGCLSILVGCHSPGQPTPAASLELVANALALGDLSGAQTQLAMCRQRQPQSAAVSAWAATLEQMRGNTESALAMLHEALANQGLPEAELHARIGDLLLVLGHYRASVPHLVKGQSGEEGQRRVAFAELLSAARDAVALTDSVTLPLLGNEFPELAVECGGRARSFVLDTGASLTTVSDSLAADLSLPQPRAAGMSRDGLEHAMSVRASLLSDLTLGSVNLGDQPCLVVQDRHLSLRDANGSPIQATHGILGLDVLMRYAVTINRSTKTVTLGPRSNRALSDAAALVRLASGLLASVQVDGCRLWFVVDTGASHSSLSEAGLQQLPGGSSRAKTGYRQLHTPGGSSVSVRTVTGMSMVVADAKFTDLALPVIARPANPWFPIHGVLGCDLLMRCEVTIDGPQLQMRPLQ